MEAITQHPSAQTTIFRLRSVTARLKNLLLDATKKEFWVRAQLVSDKGNGPGWPVKNAVQATFAGTNDGRWGNGDCIVARFRRT